MGAPTAIASIGIITNLVGTASASASYNAAGTAALSAAQYNSKLIERNLNLELNSISRELRTFSSTQRAQIAASGVSVSSKSALAVMNESLRSFEKEAVISRENARLKINQEQFNARQQRDALRLEARASSIKGIARSALDLGNLFRSLSG